MSYLSREVCVVFARDGISHSAKGSNQLNPGVSMSGNVVFDVPTNLTKNVDMVIQGGMLSLAQATVQLN